jgi:DNA-binding transcriptional LysR family regulator
MADEVRAELAPGGARGKLRIGAMESTAATRLPEILARFHHAHPDTQVELGTGTARHLLDRLLAGDIDLAFAAGDCRHEALVATHAFRETLVLAVPAGAPGDLDLAAGCQIAFPAGCAYRGIVGRYLHSRGIEPHRIVELASYHAILACVAGGMGWAIVPESLLMLYPQRQLLDVRALPRAVARQTTWLVRRRHSSSASVEAFRALLP